MSQRRILRQWPLPLKAATGLLAVTLVQLVGGWATRLPTGLVGRYYAGTDWKGSGRLLTIDPEITTARVAHVWPLINEPFAVRWKAFVPIQRAGRYRFATTSDDGSWVYVDQRLVVDNGGHHSSRRARGEIELARGVHELQVDFLQAAGPFSIELLWAEGDRRFRPFSGSDAFQRRPATVRLVLYTLFSRTASLVMTAWTALYLFTVAVYAFIRPLRTLIRHECPRGLPRPMLLVLALTAVIGGAGIWWGLPWGRWAPDELGPADVLSALEHHFSQGWWAPHPPAHYYVLSIVTLPFSLIQFTQCCRVDPGVLDFVFVLGSRVVSVGMALGTVLLVYVCGLHLFDVKSSTYAALILALTSPFVFYAKLANVDVPYVFWFSLSLLGYLRVLRRGSRADYILFASAATLAICTKDQAYGLYALPALAVAWITYERAAGHSVGTRLKAALLDDRILWALLIAVGLFVAGYNLVWNLAGFMTHVRVLMNSRVFRIFEPTLNGQLSMLQAAVWLTRLSLGWPMFILCISGVVVAFAHRRLAKFDRLWWVVLPALSYYVTFMMIVGYIYDRFLLPVLITLSLFGGFAAALAVRQANHREHVARTLVIRILVGATFVYTAAYAGSVDLAMLRDSRYMVERWLRNNVPETAVIGTTGFLTYLPRLDPLTMVRLNDHLTDLQDAKPDYVVMTADFAAHFPESMRLAEQLGYRRMLDFKSPVGLAGVQLDRRWDERTLAFTNLAKVNPRIIVLSRDGGR